MYHDVSRFTRHCDTCITLYHACIITVSYLMTGGDSWYFVSLMYHDVSRVYQGRLPPHESRSTWYTYDTSITMSPMYQLVSRSVIHVSLVIQSWYVVIHCITRFDTGSPPKVSWYIVIQSWYNVSRHIKTVSRCITKPWEGTPYLTGWYSVLRSIRTVSHGTEATMIAL